MLRGFPQDSFDVFAIPGLEPRMEAIKTFIRPQLEEIGSVFSPILSQELGEEFFFHVAKHARRTVNPPNDTWVAWSTSKRGYKSLPHFQVGLWQSHLFIWFAIIYESPIKGEFAQHLMGKWTEVKNHIPENYVWSVDHTLPSSIPHYEMNDDKMAAILKKLKNNKKSELLCGINLKPNHPGIGNGQELMNLIESTFLTLKPLYELAKGGVRAI